ncbi:hypothetical protein [Azotobacter beijerinckii]|uniref:Uncharacterized protein n=1 Tax=Azotobacter beijerinckii TaxID=170623 RepID=A0A1I4GVM0_9GAMM|nr:hypothetical protein [Azotobacter beijerinckii]SFL33979.1 hypothetical protein SAMN04244574_04006 [Azotobacter beijerinckii]
MSRKSEFKDSIGDFIAGQIANTNSPQAARLAAAFKREIERQREEGIENENALSLDARYEEGDFVVRVAFHEDYTMTVMYGKDTDNVTVGALYLGLDEADDELCRMAGLMLSEGWVEGYDE